MGAFTHGQKIAFSLSFYWVDEWNVAIGNQGQSTFCDSAEKPYECFDDAQHERKISNNFTRSSVRPEALEG